MTLSRMVSAPPRLAIPPPLLSDWLHGCHAAQSLEEALAERERLQPGEVIFVRSGHAVTRHSVSFYAPDSEQAGLLARAQEIENLERELRAQALITDESRAALVLSLIHI